MKGWMKLLVLGAVPILAVTMVADQAFAADKGSQLIFQANSNHTSFISVANANSDRAVTVLVQYYNESMEMVVWYLRVITGDGNFLVNTFDHMIPGTATEDDMDGTNVMEAIMGSGKASTHYVIAVTAVGANLKGLPAEGSQLDPVDLETEADPPVAIETVANMGPTANVLFPDFLAADMHGTDNIDNGGVITSAGGRFGTAGTERTTLADPTADPPTVAINDNRMQTEFDGADDATDNTSKNVGEMTISNAEPVAFNHLTGHFTEALVGAAGGSDQTASWGGTPVIRPAVMNNDNDALMAMSDYTTLNGTNNGTHMVGGTDSARAGGRLAEKDAGGNETLIDNVVAGWTDDGDNLDGDGMQIITDGLALNRGLNGGALVLPAAHGGGVEGAKQIMLLLSVADDFGDRAIAKGGDYKLIAAKTGYMVTVLDNMGNSMSDPDAGDDPVFGGIKADEVDAKSARIIVEGISVTVDAGDCNGGEDDTVVMGPWTVGELAALGMGGASEGFGGVASMGMIKFMRAALKCTVPYGDGDQAELVQLESPDGVPIKNDRTYDAGTLITEEKNTERTFVTTGQALLKLLLSDATFAASWSLKSPPSSDDAERPPTIDPDGPTDGDTGTLPAVTITDDITDRQDIS